MFTITYKLKNYADETEYKIQVERHEEACFIHQSLEYCRTLYIVTSRYPSFQVLDKKE